jgi:adenine phosphoribosyltransferase
MTHQLAATIRSIPDFPKKGILFRDITTLLNNPGAFRQAVDLLTDRYAREGITKVVSIESRGFILGAPIAYHLGAGFVPVRKPGKLPAPAIRETYTLEYGTDTLEIHQDAITPADRVLIVDDLLATGGTVGAACKLVERLGGTIVGCAFLIELSFLGGRGKLGKYDVEALVDYAGEE